MAESPKLLWLAGSAAVAELKLPMVREKEEEEVAGIGAQAVRVPGQGAGPKIWEEKEEAAAAVVAAAVSPG